MCSYPYQNEARDERDEADKWKQLTADLVRKHYQKKKARDEG